MENEINFFTQVCFFMKMKILLFVNYLIILTIRCKNYKTLQF